FRADEDHPSVVVVVEKGAAPAQGLQQVLLRRGGVRVLEVNPHGPGDIGEPDVGGGGSSRQQQERATGQGPGDRAGAPRHDALRPSGRRSTIPFASWITKR